MTRPIFLRRRIMYQVYIDKPSYFEPDMAGEFKDLAKAEAIFAGDEIIKA